MTNDATVQTIRTDHMRTAAVLMSEGLAFHAARRSPDKPGYVEFTLLVRSEDVPKAKGIITACRRDLDVTVHLGAYERSFREVREIIESVKETDNEPSQRGVPR